MAREHVEAEADARFVRTMADYQEREFGRGADFWTRAAALLNGAAGVGVAMGELRHEHVDGPRVGRERAVCFDFDLELIRNRRRVESVAKSWRNFYEEDDVEAACRWVIEAREWLAEMATLPRPGPPARELSGCFEYVPRGCAGVGP